MEVGKEWEKRSEEKLWSGLKGKEKERKKENVGLLDTFIKLIYALGAILQTWENTFFFLNKEGRYQAIDNF